MHDFCNIGAIEMRLPKDRSTRFVLTVALVALTATILGCDRYPRDPEDSLETALERGTLRVGLTDAGPWVVRDGSAAAGLEVRLIEEFARELGVEPRWTWAPLDENVRALERFELDLVAGGLTDQNPWAKKVGATRPFYTEHARARGSGEAVKLAHVLFVPPGENALLLRLEHYLADVPPERLEPTVDEEVSP